MEIKTELQQLTRKSKEVFDSMKVIEDERWKLQTKLMDKESGFFVRRKTIISLKWDIDNKQKAVDHLRDYEHYLNSRINELKNKPC